MCEMFVRMAAEAETFAVEKEKEEAERKEQEEDEDCISTSPPRTQAGAVVAGEEGTPGTMIPSNEEVRTHAVRVAHVTNARVAHVANASHEWHMCACVHVWAAACTHVRPASLSSPLIRVLPRARVRGARTRSFRSCSSTS